MSSSELLVLLIIGVLLFGGRLLEVARSIGRVYRRFRSTLYDLQAQIQFDLDEPPPDSGTSRTLPADPDAEREEVAVPKFVPPVDSDAS